MNLRSRLLAPLLALLVAVPFVVFPTPAAAGGGPPPGGTFLDDNGLTFEASIEAIAAAGITAGCGPQVFCPDGLVTRAQMATFLVRALNLPAATRLIAERGPGIGQPLIRRRGYLGYLASRVARSARGAAT